MATQIKFLSGNYIFKRGVPSVLVVATHARGDEFLGQGFTFIQKLPPGTGYEVSYIQLEYDLSEHRFMEFGINDPETFVLEETIRAVEGAISLAQWEQYEKTKEEAALRKCELKYTGDWKEELLRLRLRGLSEAEMKKIAEQVAAEEVVRHLNSIKYVPVMTVRNVQ